MKERMKWEYSEYQYGDARGLRGPRVYEEFPKMLYKAGRNAANKIDLLAKEVAKNAQEEANLMSRGFVFGPDKAIAAAENLERDVAKHAAERAYQERTMSEPARREAAAIDDSTADHVPVIAETPIKKRGRPAKPLTVPE